jgi:hypothetical protein
MRSRRMAIAVAMTLVAVVLTLAACGGGDDDETTTSPAPSAAAPGGGAPAPELSRFPPSFVQCLADQGIDVGSITDVSAAIHSPQGNRCFDELHGG